MSTDREKIKKQYDAVRAAARETLTRNALLRATAVHLNMENRRLLRKMKEAIRRTSRRR